MTNNMTCEIMIYCRFFIDKMKNMPKTEEYIKNRFCLDNYASCNRYKIYKEFGGKQVPYDLDPSDIEEVKKVMKHLGEK